MKKREKSCRRAICPSRLQRQKAQIRFCLSRRIRRRRSICAASSVTATKTAYGLRWTRKPPQRKKDLFYWLHQSGFYPQSQLATAARLMGNYQSGSVSVQNLAGCSLYRYEPCTVLPERAGLTKNKIQPSTLETNGLRGERGYSYETVSDAQTILPELLDFLQKRYVGRREIVLTDGKRVPRICIFLRADRACGVPRAAWRSAGSML